MSLRADGVYVRYGSVEALRGISITVADGSTVAVIGANGAGKSTLLRAISGVVPLISGEIWFGDVRVDKLRPHRVVGAGIAHVPEGRRLFPHMTVEQNLRMGAYLRRDGGITSDLERVYELFPVLREKRRDKCWSLSGGQQQMASIGRALMAKPHLLLLDEPSLGLSPQMVLALERALVTIRSDYGTTILLVEQNTHMALRLASRAYVLQDGVVALEGDADELRKEPKVRAAYLGG